jgi:hypothetical protein
MEYLQYLIYASKQRLNLPQEVSIRSIKYQSIEHINKKLSFLLEFGLSAVKLKGSEDKGRHPKSFFSFAARDPGHGYR